MRAVVLKTTEENTSLEMQDIPDIADIGANDLVIQHTAVGVNFDDVMYRRGAYTIPDEYKENTILGFEGVGNVVRKGENVKGFEVGDQVGYAFSPFGAYAQQRVIDYRYVVNIPTDIAPEFAAGVLRRGLMAETLLFHAVNCKKNDWILIHSIAGGVGHLLSKWAKYVGLRVIGTVCDNDKVATALATGADFVINRKDEDVSAKVYEYTGGYGVRAVFDGIGKDVYECSINSLAYYGIYVSYGYASGFVEPKLADFREKNLFFTTPTLETYKQNRYELIYAAASLFELVKKGIIVPNISRYGFDGIPQAHADLESGKTMGSLVVNVY